MYFDFIYIDGSRLLDKCSASIKVVINLGSIILVARDILYGSNYDSGQMPFLSNKGNGIKIASDRLHVMPQTVALFSQILVFACYKTNVLPSK